MIPLDAKQLVAVERMTLLLAGIVIGAAMLALPIRISLGVSVGAVLMTLNAWSLRRIGQRAVNRPTRPGFGILLFNLKMALLIALVFVIIRYTPIDPIGFLIGVSVFPVAVVISALRFGLGDNDGSGDTSTDETSTSGEQ